MPLYEYQCLGCCARFELRRSFSDTSGVTCPQCHGEVQRVLSPVAVVFKGPGFYATDNGKKSANPKEPERHGSTAR
jgi:putative FmdB family regulatory protein